MLSLINFVEAATTAVFIVRIILAALCLIAVAFIIYVVMKQSGNSDGIEAMTGSSSDKSDESETYYGQNAGSRKEAKLKLWTYISAGVLAVACIALIVLSVIFPAA